MSRTLTPSQTIGPYLHILFGWETSCDMSGGAAGAIDIAFRVLDSDGAPLADAMVEIWQAHPSGRYAHPEDTQDKALVVGFTGFGRAVTGTDGIAKFRTLKPGAVPGRGNTLQAPHLNVSVFGRGLLNRLPTRLYLPGDALNANDPVLASVPEDRRGTLIARPEREGYAFDVRLGGPGETVFFDI
jgi:protocatechuate 3,4-dioxygenase, alpha subunit